MMNIKNSYINTLIQKNSNKTFNRILSTSIPDHKEMSENIARFLERKRTEKRIVYSV